MSEDTQAPRMWTFTTIELMDDGPHGGGNFILKTMEGPEVLVGIEGRGRAAKLIIMDGTREIDQYEGPAAMGVLYFAQDLWMEASRLGLVSEGPVSLEEGQ